MNNNLKDKFLYFCNAENDEDYFSKTLIYLCEIIQRDLSA